MQKLTRSALVTGGAKRIGKEIALSLSLSGFKIALHYNHSQKEAREIQEEIQDLGGTCEIFACDFAKGTQTQKLIAAVKKRFPDLQLLINNASIFEMDSIFERSLKKFDTHFTVNFKTPFILTQEFARTCKSGHIINILDTNITRNRSKYFSYLLSKKCLAELTQFTALELAPKFRVNAIAPGFILPPSDNSPRKSKDRLKKIPLEKKGEPYQILQTIEFLIRNDYVTGQIIYSDGGEHLL